MDTGDFMSVEVQLFRTKDKATDKPRPHLKKGFFFLKFCVCAFMLLVCFINLTLIITIKQQIQNVTEHDRLELCVVLNPLLKLAVTRSFSAFQHWLLLRVHSCLPCKCFLDIRCTCLHPPYTTIVFASLCCFS